MKHWIGLAAAALAAAGCHGIDGLIDHGPQTKGSGKLKSESRKVGAFSSVETRGAADCEITVGGSPSLEISADDNILPLIETTVEDGKLIIGSKGNYSTRNGVKVKITTPSLDGFSVKGSGDSTLRGIRSKAFQVAIFGSGDVQAFGQADRLDASISGSGNLDLDELKAAEGKAMIAGSGNIDLNVSGNLEATIRGSGNIGYVGSPKQVSKHVSGSGEIHGK